MRGSKRAVILIGVLACLGMPIDTSAATARLSWSPNTEPDLEGYRVFVGTSSRAYTKTITIGRITSIDIADLSPGATYYFALKAFDFSGNESPYSDEVRLSVPSSPAGSGTSSGGSGSSSGVIDEIAAALERLQRDLMTLFGLGPEVPLYGLGSFSSVASASAPSGAYPEGAPLIDQAGLYAAALTRAYPVRDVILEVDQAFDLSVLYPDGSFLFFPLSDTYPEIEDGIVTPGEPGSFLYVAFDEALEIDHVLRISVATEICDICSYDPGLQALLADMTTGAVVAFGTGATDEARPLALCRGGSFAPAPSAVATQDPASLTFDILPYGLELASPAVVTIPWQEAAALVEIYDEDRGLWVPIEDTLVEGGLVSFSTQELGRFRVSAPPEETRGDDGSWAGAETCFIEACR